jgi:hypothetical protein
MNHLSVVAAVLLAATTAPAAVDPGLLDLVMPDAQVLAGMQVQQSLASPFGQYFLTQIPSNDGVSKFAAATGLDLRRDVREILMASVGGTLGAGNANPGLILVRGTFQPDRFIALATLSGSSVTPENGVLVITPPRNAQGTSLAFLDSSMLVIGDRASVKSAIARHAANATFAGPLGQQAQIASGANDAWLTTLTPLAQFMGGANTPLPLALLQSVGGISAGVHFDAGAVTLLGEISTMSEKDAQSMADTLKFLAAMLQANKNQNPQAAALLQSAQFTATGPVMRMSLSVPEQQMEQIFVLPGAKPKKIAAFGAPRLQ